MPLVILPSFIRDLQEHGDANFAKRVLRRVMQADGTFRTDGKDHRYERIKDGWIRYVSEGTSAYRAIYIRKGDDIYLYRAGEHSVERDLVAPKSFMGVEVGCSSSLPMIETSAVPSERSPVFLRNQPEYSLHTALISRRLIPHKEVYLITPYLSVEFLYRTSRVGRMLRDLKDDGASITLITRPVSNDEPIKVFEELEQDGIDVQFCASLHAKVYAFLIDPVRRKPMDAHEDLVVLGSANLTYDGIVAPQESGYEELCIALGPAAVETIETYVLELMTKSMDLMKLKMDRARRKIG